MRLRLLQALTNTTILVLLAVSVWLFYVFVVGTFFFTVNGVGYAVDAPVAIRLSALLLLITVSLSIRLLWLVRRRTIK